MLVAKPIQEHRDHDKLCRHLSPLMGRKLLDKNDKVVNACPFGCKDHELDPDTGYCDHLIGFCNVDRDGNPEKTYEPLIAIRHEEGELKGDLIRRVVKGGRNRRPTTDSMYFERATTSFRVYGEKPRPAAPQQTPKKD